MNTWREFFRKGEKLRTEVRSNPFHILDFQADGVQVRTRSRVGTRKVVLSYDHLDALWRNRAHITNKGLTASVNRIFKANGLKPDYTYEAHYWAVVCERERRQNPLVDVDQEAIEGVLKLVQHLRRERNAKLIAHKKALVLKETGRLACEACGFDFAERYSKLGQQFCEVHHKRALGYRTRPSATKLTDLAVLCSNCHRMIHRTNPMESVEKFKARLGHNAPGAKAQSVSA